MSSGVACRIPCSFACSMAFFRTSSSVFPRTTCVHPEDGSTEAHSMTLLKELTPFCPCDVGGLRLPAHFTNLSSFASRGVLTVRVQAEVRLSDYSQTHTEPR